MSKDAKFLENPNNINISKAVLNELIDLKMFQAETKLLRDLTELIVPSNTRASDAQETANQVKLALLEIKEDQRLIMADIDYLKRRATDIDSNKKDIKGVDNRLKLLEVQTPLDFEKMENITSNLEQSFFRLQTNIEVEGLKIKEINDRLKHLNEQYVRLRTEATKDGLLRLEDVMDQVQALHEKVLGTDQELSKFLSLDEMCSQNIQSLELKLQEVQSVFEDKMIKFEPKNYGLFTVS